ncbi:MAG: hypothetical protein ED557_02320 [Balneola sp.]|nr:MAG: hypothetical protein ED557_02320 [Balneola sp.]
MKKNIFSLLILTILLTAPGSVQAQNDVALGGELINPVGLSYKFGISDNSAITGALGLILEEGNTFVAFEMNYLSYRNPESINIKSGHLSPYFGVGLSVGASPDSEESLSIRIPLGLEYTIDDTPFELYMDIGPFITVTDPQGFTFDSALGFRYRF